MTACLELQGACWQCFHPVGLPLPATNNTSDNNKLTTATTIVINNANNSDNLLKVCFAIMIRLRHVRRFSRQLVLSITAMVVQLELLNIRQDNSMGQM